MRLSRRELPRTLERPEGIEPSLRAWEAHVLPLNHDRKVVSKVRVELTRLRRHRLLGPACLPFHHLDWSDWRESNPRLDDGNVVFFR